MKTRFLALGLMTLLPACVQIAPQPPTSARAQEVRVSDGYSRKAVKSYQVFHSGIEGHAIVVVRLGDGRHFPMLFRKTDKGIYPIPQSVFGAQGAGRWSILCEPHVGQVYALRRLELSSVDGALFMAGGRLAPSAMVPLLDRPAL